MATLGVNDVQLVNGLQTIVGTGNADNIDMSSASDSEQLQNTVLVINGGAGDDEIKGSLFHNIIDGGLGDDVIHAGYTFGFEQIDGGEGNDTVIFPFSTYDIKNYSNENDVISFSTNSTSLTQLTNIEFLSFAAPTGAANEAIFYTLTPEQLDSLVNYIDLTLDVDMSTYVIAIGNNNSNDVGTITFTSVNDIISLFDSYSGSNTIITVSLADPTPPSIKINGIEVTPENYSGLVDYLEFQFIGESSNETVIGSASNDFFNLKGGDDAVEGGAGDDVLDGGTGSNFLTGGDGNDTFFLDGRGGTTTWSTIADFNGDAVNIWGWIVGVSRLLISEENAGAEGFLGATLHYDLNNDGSIDTSITFSDLTLAAIPKGLAAMVEDNGYLLFA